MNFKNLSVEYWFWYLWTQISYERKPRVKGPVIRQNIKANIFPIKNFLVKVMSTKFNDPIVLKMTLKLS
jgi:hypothetical protein